MLTRPDPSGFCDPPSVDIVHSVHRPLERPDGPAWYQQAVVYQVLVGSFQDSDGDGVGDLRGLTSRLDYLAWLGIDCLWLSPIYPSPLRDGGYDVADYCDVHPAFGTLADFVELIHQAHARGIRIITDFVLNHTSDRHPWFQESRRDPKGPYGDFYVWASDDMAYAEAPIVFRDVESSNWTFDPCRQQYYWHRFYSHQPDLNYENEDVQESILNAVRFWLDLGVDGFRLDAVPYLYEEEGTACAHLPRTHEFLRRIRKEIDTKYQDKVLLAEANGQPAEVAAYFGAGDECHMAFNFPLMPRLFMAMRRESREPLAEIMATTPGIPPNCQWAIFLRNHDELALETVADEDRTYLWAEYAEHARMRANLGIRRRLAPLLDNDQRRLELVTALLLSLPGSPVLYYGDEIGMGDNVWLDDRDGVRTPMHWTTGDNAGFSNCQADRLRLPVLTDPHFGYQLVNVATQHAWVGSLLHQTRRMIEIRRQYSAFGAGRWEDVASDNRHVFSFMRIDAEDAILCVTNLSRSAQRLELDLQSWAGYRPVDLLGRADFTTIENCPMPLTVKGHSFLWLRMVR